PVPLSRQSHIGHAETERRRPADMARASGGKPVHANLLLRFTNDPDIWRTCLDVLEGYAREGLRVYPMASANPKGLHLALADTILLDEMPTFRSTLSKPMPERMQALRDPAIRARMREEFDKPGARQLAFGWNELRVASVRDDTNAKLVGRTVGELAAERSADPLDAFLDLALSEDLE